MKIRGGIFTNTVQSCIMNWYKANISGGKFNGSENVDSVYNGSYTYTDTDTKVDFTMIGDLTITGGTFTGAIVAVNYEGQATADPATSISGGTFSTAVKEEYCAAGYAPKYDESTGTYTVKEKGITWIGTTDSGIYTVEGTKYGVMRFMFSTDVDLSKSSVSKIGIKYINANAISDPINNKGTEVYANNASGKNAVQGDINEIIPESATGTYYALAYIEVDGKPYWSTPISCTLNTSKELVGYTPQTEGGNE